MAWDWITKNVNDIRNKAKEEVAKFKNADFLNAVISACAKMAYADGMVDPKEKQKMMGFIQHSDALQVFDTAVVIDTWQKISNKFDFDLDVGNIEAMKMIGKLKSKPDAARAVIRVSIMIANSDGNFDDNEKKAVVEICNELGVPASEFGL
jgi:tellurite resistance protein TerB